MKPADAKNEDLEQKHFLFYRLISGCLAARGACGHPGYSGEFLLFTIKGEHIGT